MKRRTLYFTGPGRLECRQTTMPSVGADQVLVQTQLSAISAGTELLVYRGEFPRSLPDGHDCISHDLSYPLSYGYAAVGTVIEVGRQVDPLWSGRSVFSFRPHSSHFLASADDLLPLPDGLDPADAVFLPSMETAVNIVQDAAPVLGERCLVLGQGVVGLLAAALLQEFPLESLVTVDRYELRRKTSRELGVMESLDPASHVVRDQALAYTGTAQEGYDLVVELTGSPAALDDAIALSAYSGRIIVGSWFGNKTAPIDLGGTFHRSRVKLVASQVSTISPELSGRWDKLRRFGVVWSALGRIRPARFITHRFRIEDAADAYQLLDRSAADALQVVLNYD